MQKSIRFFLIISALLAASAWRTWLFYLVPPPDYSDGKVLLYTTDWCPYCEKARRLLETKGIAFKEVNIETSETGRAQYQRLAGDGIPLLLVAGEVVRGYQPRRIEAVLSGWQQRQQHIPE